MPSRRAKHSFTQGIAGRTRQNGKQLQEVDWPHPHGLQYMTAVGTYSAIVHMLTMCGLKQQPLEVPRVLMRVKLLQQCWHVLGCNKCKTDGQLTLYLTSPSIRRSRVKKMLEAAGSMWGLVRSKNSCISKQAIIVIVLQRMMS